jgi:uncharacterized membrane protein
VLGRKILIHLRHHARFYIAVLLGLAMLLLAPLGKRGRLLAAGDLSSLVYLIAMTFATFRLKPEHLRTRAAEEDEGIALVILIVLVTVGFSCAAVVEVLKEKESHGLLLTVLAIAAAPLGWLTLHTVAAFHYANLYYAPVEPSGPEKPGTALVFPGTECPGPWEFLYFALVIGMTAQVSDVQVASTVMRRATLGHSVVSFFFNTAIIALAVNAIVALAV